MEKVRALLVIFLTLPLAASAASPVDLLDPDCKLQRLIAILESKEPVKSDFTEFRSNPFQRRPRRFEGSIYWHPRYGLCLEYSSPSSTRINVTQQKISIGKPGQAPREMPITDDNPALSMFLKLFGWDTGWIASNFITQAEYSDTGIELLLEPVDTDMRQRLNGITLKVGAEVLESIELDLSGQKEIQIRLHSQVIPWEPDEATLSAQFNMHNEGD